MAALRAHKRFAFRQNDFLSKIRGVATVWQLLAKELRRHCNDLSTEKRAEPDVYGGDVASRSDGRDDTRISINHRQEPAIRFALLKLGLSATAVSHVAIASCRQHIFLVGTHVTWDRCIPEAGVVEGRASN
jgi:hypothetical protein